MAIPCSRAGPSVRVWARVEYNALMKIILASPRGFCAGVNMAVESLDLALKAFGPPIYVYHEIVHNRYVVDSFRSQGAVFVEELDDVPESAYLLFSAHGVSPEIRQIANERKLHAINATCPLVTKVHLEALRFAKQGYCIVLIGHEGHDEVVGTMGQAPQAILLVESPEDVDRLTVPPDAKIAYLTQTTLSVDDANRVIARLKERFPQIVGPPKEDICYATQNRQEAVSLLSQEAGVVIVLGSQNSSNSQRLKELAKDRGIAAYLIDGVADLQLEWFSPDDVVLVTAGASAPESVVQECVDFLKNQYDAVVEVRTLREEQVHFQLPKELRAVV
jgi:4-hydroxy-3-methylbut-2-enyl diphosphate reductase